MGKKKHPPKSVRMTDEGPILDMAGDMDCSSNFGNVLAGLCTRKTPLPKRTKVTVCVSTVRYLSREIPERVSLIKTYTFGYLERKYKELYGHFFDLEKHTELQSWRFELLRKEGERRSAWGMYRQTMDLYRTLEEEEKINRLPKDAQGVAREKRSNRTRYLVIS